MAAKTSYTFSSDLWAHSTAGGWHFVTLPKNISKEIRNHLYWQEEGWGRMKVVATIEDVEWNTAIWFDNKQATYLLLIKASIRKKKLLEDGDVIRVELLI